MAKWKNSTDTIVQRHPVSYYGLQNYWENGGNCIDGNIGDENTYAQIQNSSAFSRKPFTEKFQRAAFSSSLIPTDCRFTALGLVLKIKLYTASDTPLTAMFIRGSTSDTSKAWSWYVERAIGKTEHAIEIIAKGHNPYDIIESVNVWSTNTSYVSASLHKAMISDLNTHRSYVTTYSSSDTENGIGVIFKGRPADAAGDAKRQVYDVALQLKYNYWQSTIVMQSAGGAVQALLPMRAKNFRQRDMLPKHTHTLLPQHRKTVMSSTIGRTTEKSSRGEVHIL